MHKKKNFRLSRKYKHHFRTRSKVKYSQVKNAKKIGLTLFLVLIISGITLFVYKNLFSSERFRIKQIYITGLNSVTTKEFINNISIKIKDNLLVTFFIRDFEKKIKDIYPQIKQIKTYRKLPDKIEFKITERNPIANIRISNKLYSVDDENTVFSVLLTTGTLTNQQLLPEIMLYSNNADTRNVAVEFIKQLSKIDKQMFNRIKKLYIRKNNDILLLLNDNTNLVWGEFDKLQMQEKLKYCYKVIQDNKFSQLEYIDLKLCLQGRVVVKPR